MERPQGLRHAPRQDPSEAGYMPIAKKPNIAICYDFDGTLIRGNMQENSFLPDIDIRPAEFWELVKARARERDMDEVLA